MGKILDTVAMFLTKDDWNFERDDKEDLITAGIKGRNASFRLFVKAREETEQLLVVMKSPNNIPEGRRVEAAEFLTRANWGLTIGNFEMDMQDGEVRYKVSVDVEGGELTAEMAGTMIRVGAIMMDKYYPGLMTISFGGKSPLDAIREIEN